MGVAGSLLAGFIMRVTPSPAQNGIVYSTLVAITGAVLLTGLTGYATGRRRHAYIVAVGAGKMEKGRRIPLDVKVADRILFGKYTGNDIKLDGQEYLILREGNPRDASWHGESGVPQKVASRI